jgi:maltokinase
MRGDAPVALVTENLPGARDGWEWCVEAFGDDFGAALGELAARLHAALATASSALPAPVRPSSTQDRNEWAAQAEAALAEALALTDGPDGEWLASVAPLLRRDLAPLSSPQPVPLLRVHGDLHVGQILRWPGGYRVIDFDGNPTAAERAEHQPAARDVAQLLTSLDHVAMIVAKTSDRAAALARARELRTDLLAGYRATPAARGLLDADEGLLRAFEVEQECRELIYAAKFLPRWRYAPIGVLRTWYA